MTRYLFKPSCIRPAGVLSPVGVSSELRSAHSYPRAAARETKKCLQAWAYFDRGVQRGFGCSLNFARHVNRPYGGHASCALNVDHEEPDEQPASEHSWHRLNPSWEATEEMAMRTGITRHLISPAWRVLLLSDGSTTRHLQLLTDIEVKVDLVQMAEIGYKTETLPSFAKVVKGPRLQRQVYLRSAGDGEALLYATSWWAIDNARGYLKDVNKPIWASLEMLRTDIYRSIGRLYYGENEDLSKAFGYPGPFWARHYIFWHDDVPITVIYEVFSNKLEKYLGPAQPQP